MNPRAHERLPTPPAVVAELDDVVLVAVPLGVHDEAEEGRLLLLPVDHHPPAEEPVAAVLAGTQRDTHRNRVKNKNKEDAQWGIPPPHLLD